VSDDRIDRGSYRPHLDGLRAVAVYLVVAFHAGASRLAGGFIGVDVFFVLSGYLVTNLLLRELDGPDGGRIDLARFYARRMRRLLPAAVVTLAATVVVFREVANPLQLDAAVDAIRAAALYVSNWYFIEQSTDYFAEDLTSSPVLHFWSLSVEEQFYFVWPLLLLGLHRLSRRFGTRQAAALRIAVAGLALASVSAALLLATSRPERAYFGTDTRAYQLLAGALLALSPMAAAAVGRRLRSPAVRTLAGTALLGALLVLATTWLDVGPVSRGVLTTVTTVALLIALEAGEGGLGRAVLSLPPVVYLGKISYGTYLWHWLVVIVLGLQFDLTPTQTLAVTAAVATGLASLSFQVLESPVRTSVRLDRSRRAVIAAGLAASLLVAVAVAPRVTEPSGGVVASSADSGVSAPGAIDEADEVADATVPAEALGVAFTDNFDYDACPSSGSTLCTLAEGEGLMAVVVGDSHAGVWATMLADLAQAEDMTLLGGLLSFCPWPRGIRYPGAGPDCYADQDDLFDRLLPEADPDIVFLSHRAFDDPNDPLQVRDVDAGLVGGAARDEAVAQRARETVQALVADGRTVVIFEPIPVAPTDLDPLACLSTATSHTASCRFLVQREPTPEDLVLRELDAAHEQVVSIDADRLTCPYLPICDPVLEGLVVRRDGNHLTATYARSLEDDIEAVLVAHGVLDG
jgi:peptidoglycan/LPS O-acetylase OafA/YrhL